MSVSYIGINYVVTPTILIVKAYFMQYRGDILISWFIKHFWEVIDSSRLKLSRSVISLDFTKQVVENTY
jgi:hypothetical protein